MELTRLIEHPELMDKETLYDLRSLLALHPYYQTARLLMLQNLFLLHDPSFDAELRKGAIYITDRAMLFNLVEAAHYQLRTEKPEGKGTPQEAPVDRQAEAPQENRTISLINDFLDSIPKEEEDDTVQKRKPTLADAAVDYVSYLMETEQEEKKTPTAPMMKGQSLIDDFIQKEGGKIQLKEDISYKPEEEVLANEEENDADEGYFTETLAKIYIKQGRYSKALEIIQRLNLNYPKKNAYFADQIRFLEKLILNNKQNN